ncbi:COMM domain-containing protein 9 [Hibiscus syriacus]|uniref:Exocyst subunit Exo70 family protein n=1 Tax=Hibiscus syriacus TaxID=106335 RepID=A0A6A2ZRY8_HIBSY|nr:COMM domain-containing protein 9 [Hibiscus syriacus]
MEPTTTTTSLGPGGEDRVMATAQHIVNSLNTPKEVREGMLSIFSSFDNRLSNISGLISDSDSTGVRFDAAEKVILGWNPDASCYSLRWEDSPDETAEFLSAIDEILKSVVNMSVRSNNEIMDRAETSLQMAMSRLEDEFRLILIRNSVPLDAKRLYGSIRKVSLSFAVNEVEIDEDFESFAQVGSEIECFHERGASFGDDLCVDLINSDSVTELKEIADRMIRSGYEKECVQAYCNVRRDALNECLLVLGVEKLSIEEVQKIEWKSLDEKMKKWIQAVKLTVRVLVYGEKRLCDQIFDGSDSIKETCYNETAKGCIMQLLNFGEAVSIGKRSSEKLFRILDMYDVLADALLDFKMMVMDEFVCSEVKGVLAELGEAAKGTFMEFENALKNEASKIPMHNGEIHPLTRYVMNYVTLLVDYNEMLNSLLENNEDVASGLEGEDIELETKTPFAKRLLSLTSSLETNLEEKSKLYEDGALHFIFLMNNILYIVQKVKDSELRKLLGDNWVRTRSGQIRQYATSYLRACWINALHCLKDEGIGSSSNNAFKVTLKERFKSFNACFEETYRTQTGWKSPRSSAS